MVEQNAVFIYCAVSDVGASRGLCEGVMLKRRADYTLSELQLYLGTFLAFSLTHIGKSPLVVSRSALLWVRMVLVKGSLHSEVDYDNG